MKSISMKIHTLILLVYGILGISALSFSQDILNQPSLIDTAVHIGKLDNGMTYYIRHNEEPKERASLYIIQNVGALLENDSQNGPTQEDLDKVVKNLLKEREQSRNNNSYWYNAIIFYYRAGFNRDSEENYENILNNLDSESMKEFASAFFKNSNIIDLVFKPSDE